MADSSLNLTDVNAPHAGWVSSSRDRGSIDILWSACFTIFLCIWVATHPNAVAPNERTWHRFQDKLRLAMVALLGPDFLMALAAGQFSSAWRSVKAFKKDSHLCNGIKWTLSHGFLADMGGIHLTSPDYPDGFPISAAQVHYLVVHKHIDFPDLEKMNIEERSTSDILSRLLTVWQALWFSVAELQRARQGLPMTPLELTALSFVLLMLITEIFWLKKPSLMKPRSIPTKDDRNISDILDYAKAHTHPNLSRIQHRTPMSFVETTTFEFSNHCTYYIYLVRYIGLGRTRKLYAREVWDRFPADMWLPIERSLWLPCAFMLILFALVLLPGWFFHFPSQTEQLLWRIVIIYHCVFTFAGGLYYFFSVLKWDRDTKKESKRDDETLPSAVQEDSPTSSDVSPSAAGSKPEACNSAYLGEDLESQEQTHEVMRKRTIAGFYRRAARYFDSWRNTSPNNDPNADLRLRFAIPYSIASALYVLCRAYIYVEDFTSLREQPVGVYVTVNRFVPFIGD
ncbi:hypothetical protein S7711_06938 [Stachybotrys chartarum IBT 7711]|uniref:Uncharacterized protein n=1 Tax=Stachybotrys chartarum (strain CBS 109288 / IBT 7711) TaxID=1280523 RepID=A0A084AL51_STACB|nr:hypothetical protein S7711_06938 [Stachybotrys chartarum IBT 7711]KFA74912.1 hypothetical protein S40288_06788 [Stachybotrys chartarum IBT 40288]